VREGSVVWEAVWLCSYAIYVLLVGMVGEESERGVYGG